MDVNFKKYRLPKTIQPIHYEIYINPSPTLLTFDGRVSIEISVLELTTQININSKNLEMEEIILRSKSLQREIRPIYALPSEVYNVEVIEIQFEENITPGNYFLDISYKGTISNSDTGFYYAKDPRLNLQNNLLPSQ